MEQAFSTPAMTKYGALDPLFALTATYDALREPIRWTSSGALQGAQALQEHIQDYITNCVSTDILRGATSYGHIWSSRTGVEAVRSSDNARVAYFKAPVAPLSTPGSSIFGKGSDGEYITCSKALDKLRKEVDSADVQSSLNSVEKQLYELRSTNGSKFVNWTDRKNDMMQFYSQTEQAVRDMQMQMILMPYVEQIPIQRQLDVFKGTAAVARAQTQTQQAFQWSSSGSSFLYWMTSFMPIFQAIVYAMAPFMAFLMGLGILGLRMVIKYFLIIIWTQTWVPLAAIVNLYILTRMQTDASIILGGLGGSAASGGMSFSALYDLLVAAQKNIGLAGNLFALIPSLSGFIVWGSAVAFNSLANSAAATTGADTKTLAPEMSSAPPIINRTADFGFNPNTYGATGYGTESLLGNLTIQSVASSSEASAEGKMHQAATTLSAARNEAFHSMYNYLTSGQDSTALAKRLHADLTTYYGADYARKMSNDQNLKGSWAMEVANLVSKYYGGDVGFGAGSGGLGAKVGMGTSDSDNNAAKTSKEHNHAQSNGHQLDRPIGEKSSYADGLDSIINDVITHVGSSGIGSTEAEQFTRAASIMNSTTETYAKTSEFSNSLSKIRQIPLANAAYKVANNMDKVQPIINTLSKEDQDDINWRADNFQRQYNLPSATAKGAATIEVLTEKGRLQEIGSIIGLNSQAGELTHDNASKHANLQGGDGAQQFINETKSRVKSGSDQAQKAATHAIDKEGKIAQGGPTKVAQQVPINNNHVDEDSKPWENELTLEQSRSALDSAMIPSEENLHKIASLKVKGLGTTHNGFFVHSEESKAEIAQVLNDNIKYIGESREAAEYMAKLWMEVRNANDAREIYNKAEKSLEEAGISHAVAERMLDNTVMSARNNRSSGGTVTYLETAFRGFPAAKEANKK